MKKVFVLFMCMFLASFFCSCSVKIRSNSKEDESAMKEDNSIDYQENNSSDNLQINQKNHLSEDKKAEPVLAQVKVYEGLYFDERYYSQVGIPDYESTFIYHAIYTSNITDTSFDFKIVEIEYSTKNEKEIIPINTAYFIEDGKRAVYYGDNQTLYFIFDDDQIDPTIGCMTISGYDLLEDTKYINNQIPGHEAG
ncbi:hypothetical protein [Lachnoclostridium phytofermentans]|uniref:Uncharacterized protein n=1 Tax=Lachnoclostridium phytofermentans (strain ATCC 700394 / DSM 18823 / ISDg) TaxID=357809 RepID=A9KS88_LACP7|nr:hypothetical protein [Lachnoclostridium phytofermentans]ABX42120.1 hypothetical protein Cphy_1748 [Lachnoclostridium phytofermentans ISDg]